MDQRLKRYYEPGVLTRALEDKEERAALTSFFTDELLKLGATEKRILAVLRKLRLAEGPDNFQGLAAKNRMDIDAINSYLEMMLGDAPPPSDGA